VSACFLILQQKNRQKADDTGGSAYQYLFDLATSKFTFYQKSEIRGVGSRE
jgi:hypothetical protein